jgi:hypothetical protein
VSQSLRSKVKEIPQITLRQMEAGASIAMLELSASFRKHVNGALKDMFALMEDPQPEDEAWRTKLHALARDLQGVGGSFDYALLILIGEVMCQTVKDLAQSNERALQRRLAAYAVALEAVIKVDLKGDGGANGKALLDVLKIEQPAQ